MRKLRLREVFESVLNWRVEDWEEVFRVLFGLVWGTMISLRKGKVAVAKWQLRGVGQTFKFVFEKSESFTPASSTPQKKGLLASLKKNYVNIWQHQACIPSK